MKMYTRKLADMKSVKRGTRGKLLFAAAILTVAVTWIGCSSGGGSETEYFRVVYNDNGATDGTVPVDSATYTSGQEATILGNTGGLEKNAYFIGWNTQPNGSGTTYVPGKTLTVTNDVVLYAEWYPGLQDTTDPANPADTQRVFQVRDVLAQSREYYSASCTLLAAGSHCLVYGENTASYVSMSTAAAIADTFDASIYSQIVNGFGTPEDVDGNGKIILLLLDIQDGYDGTGGYIAGFFDSGHMLDKSILIDSNEADMLFMDTYPSIAGSEDFNSTIAHEFQHLISYTAPGGPQDTWINEGLSSGAEYVYSGAVNQDRVDWFNSDPVGSIKFGNNFFVWEGYWEDEYPNSVLDNYATVSLFFQWLRIHASTDTGIYKDILNSGEVDYLAVTTQAEAKIDVQFADWTQLLSTWHIANILCKTTGFNGYGGAITVAMPGWVNQGDVEWGFYPGEAIVSATSGSTYTPPAGSEANITYRGINRTSSAIDDVPPYAGDVALVFNADSDNTNSYQTGFVANRMNGTEPSPLSSMAAARVASKKSWKVDLSIGPDGKIADASRRQLSESSRVLKKMSLQSLKKAK